MKPLKTQDIREKNLAELKGLLKEKWEELIKFKIALADKKEKNVRVGKILKNDIARIKTVLKEKEEQNG